MGPSKARGGEGHLVWPLAPSQLSRLTQYMFTQNLLCAQYCTRLFDDSGDEDGQGLCLLELGLSERQTNTHVPVSQPGPSD